MGSRDGHQRLLMLLFLHTPASAQHSIGWLSKTWTFSDVERTVQQTFCRFGLDQNYQHQIDAETRRAELALLATFQAKYAPAAED